MKPVDNASLPRTHALHTANPTGAPKVAVTRAVEPPVVKHEDSPMQALIAAIINAAEASNGHENRLAHLKKEIQENRYLIDVDRLALNMVVAENEF